MDGSDTSSTLTSLDLDEEHNTWNPLLGLLCHVRIGVCMETLFDDKGLGRVAFSCHFALDIVSDKSGDRYLG